LARKFLYVMAFLVVLVIAGAIALSIWGNDLVRLSLVPGEAFRPQPSLASRAYDGQRLWLARPGIANDPARWTPPGYSPAATPGPAAVFFIHPTSYISAVGAGHWNASLDDRDTNDRAALFLRGQASAFNAVGEIWAPRYRQATFGAFLSDRTDAERALGLAYGDVEAAFEKMHHGDVLRSVVVF